ncbi:Hsp20/alpha crystallin family protein [Nocardiopsis ansamitocini]|nr:Hsp20/alpha crystallin family protein [Nocardiopsis ansamitocini]
MPDLTELLESPLLPFRHLSDISVEDVVRDGHYVIRAELPGIDPDKDVAVTVSPGRLTIEAERREEHREGRRSEFRYGSFTRTVALPKNCDENDVTATYEKGILEVSLGLAQQGTESRRVPISSTE